MNDTQVIEATPASQSKVTGFSNRQVPWMKIGGIDETLDVRSSTEAAKHAGLDFTVTGRPVYFSGAAQQGKPPRFEKIPGRKAIVRDDTGEWLSIVSADYPIVQYGEAFDFMDGVGPKYVAAGALRGGRQGFMVVDTEKDINTPDGDTTRLYAVLRTSHDASRAVEIAAMPLRFRCMNQLTLGTFAKGATHRWSIVHAGNVTTKLQAAANSMHRLDLYAAAYSHVTQRLAAIKLDEDAAVTALRWVLPDRPRREEQIIAIMTGWAERDTVGFQGTGYGLVQAVSEYFEHDRAHGTPESRFLGALQGPVHKAINRTATYVLTKA